MQTIQVLGAHCRRCDELYASALQAASVSGLDCHVEKITDVEKMRDFKVIALPSLVVNGKVVSMGTVPAADEIARLLAST